MVPHSVIEYRSWRCHGRNRYRFLSLLPQQGGGESDFLWRPMAAASYMAGCGGETVEAKISD